MSNSKPNYFQRRTKPQGPRANERIRALDVQVIGSDGTNLGAMPLKKAVDLAKQEDLDLIEISCLLYTSPSPRDRQKCRMPSYA